MSLSFGDPFYLSVGAGLVVLLLMAFRSHARRRQALAGALGGRRAASRLSRRDLYRVRLERALLLGLAAAAVAAAAAEPRWAGEVPPPEPPPLPRSVVIAIDVSMSMQADDLPPTRLATAVDIAHDLIEALEGERVGLLLFAGNTYPLATPTLDHAALGYLLRGVTHTIASAHDPGTLLSNAIRESVTLLSRVAAGDGERGGEEAIVLIGDGEAGEPGSAVLEAVRDAGDRGIAVHAIGVGTSAGGGMVIPEAPFQLERTVVDQGGAPAISRLEETLLVQIAAAGRGEYALAGDPGDMDQLRHAVAPPPRDPPPSDLPSLWALFDWVFWLTAFAVLLLFGEGLLGLRIPRWKPSSARSPA